MSITRRLGLPGLAPLVLVAFLGAACSSGSGATATTTAARIATGSVTCRTISGALAFSPALTTKGTSPESTAITLTAAGCTTKGSNASRVTKGTGSATITSSTNSCAGLLTSRALTIDISWTPSTVLPTVLTFSGYGGASGVSGDEGFTLPDAGGTAKVTGSFAGTDHGSGSSAATFSGQTATQLLASCGSSTGLTSIQVTSGTLVLK
ncbi:MAG: hypothetical protein ABSC30_07815 [Acidimicrobiales bacterium]